MSIKKFLIINILILIFFQNSYANTKEKIYLRCAPEITVVRAGELEVGSKLNHRLMIFEFKDEIDLNVSEEPRRVLTKYKIYTVDDNGKKSKLTYSEGTYTPTIETMSMNFEDIYESSTLKYYVQMNVNYDGKSWVVSQNLSYTKVEGTNLEKENYSWFAKCSEISKKKFKKPDSVLDFEKSLN